MSGRQRKQAEEPNLRCSEVAATSALMTFDSAPADAVPTLDQATASASATWTLSRDSFTVTQVHPRCLQKNAPNSIILEL